MPDRVLEVSAVCLHWEGTATDLVAAACFAAATVCAAAALRLLDPPRRRP